jgi:hypothetical protein
MVSKELSKEQSQTREVTFKCKFCGKHKPLAEMRSLTRFFPPLVACRECEKKIG